MLFYHVAARHFSFHFKYKALFFHLNIQILSFGKLKNKNQTRVDFSLIRRFKLTGGLLLSLSSIKYLVLEMSSIFWCSLKCKILDSFLYCERIQPGLSPCLKLQVRMYDLGYGGKRATPQQQVALVTASRVDWRMRDCVRELCRSLWRLKSTGKCNRK